MGWIEGTVELKLQKTALLWKRKTYCDGVASWVLRRTIDLENILPLKPAEKGAIVILALAEDNNVLLLWTIIGLFVVDLESLKFKKLFETMIVSHYYPFESVYTAGNTMPYTKVRKKPSYVSIIG